MKENEIYYTPKEVASILKVDRNTIYQYISGGKLNAFYIGRQRRIKKSDLENFIGEKLS